MGKDDRPTPELRREAMQAAITLKGVLFPTCDGNEFISRDLDLWAYANDVTLDFSRPGKPTDNGFIEAFNSKLRAECLNAHWFMDLADAREKLEAWRRDYNEVRPHSAIGYNVPIDVHIAGGAASPPP
jgi:putative transposase